MVQIQDSEKKILSEWIPGVDLSKVKTRDGFFAEVLCWVLGAGAVTLGSNIFISSQCCIAKYPAGHPLRVGLLIHELYHVKDEKEQGLALYFLKYNLIAFKLTARALILKRIWRIRRIACFVAEHHPLEKPAYEIQHRYLQKHWTEKEAVKWGWKPEEKKQ